MAEISEILARHGFDPEAIAVVLERPFELLALVVPGGAAIEAWRRLRALVPETGRWPVLIGDVETAGRVLEPLGEGDQDAIDPEETDAILAAGLALDPAAWAAELRAEDAELYDPPREPRAEREQVWRETAAHQGFSIHLEPTGEEPLERVFVLLVPTPDGWRVPAYLRFGGWNECPEPAVHVAFLKRWHERWGAELVALGSDTLELAVLRPVLDREEALILADEQFLYCFDLIVQGAETLDRLAALLLRSTSWLFWWD
jgi:hypothetical protein